MFELKPRTRSQIRLRTPFPCPPKIAPSNLAKRFHSRALKRLGEMTHAEDQFERPKAGLYRRVTRLRMVYQGVTCKGAVRTGSWT